MGDDASYTIRCISCRTKNRIPRKKIGSKARCGRCRALMETGFLNQRRPLMVSDSEFGAVVINSPLPVLVDFFAPWCGPCRMLEPVIDELAGLWAGRVRVVKINVDNNPVTAGRFQIRSTPTMMVVENGKLRESFTGALPKHEIIAKVSPHIFG